jgi:hypothetical protein
MCRKAGLIMRHRSPDLGVGVVFRVVVLIKNNNKLVVVTRIEMMSCNSRAWERQGYRHRERNRFQVTKNRKLSHRIREPWSPSTGRNIRSGHRPQELRVTVNGTQGHPIRDLARACIGGVHNVVSELKLLEFCSLVTVFGKYPFCEGHRIRERWSPSTGRTNGMVRLV